MRVFIPRSSSCSDRLPGPLEDCGCDLVLAGSHPACRRLAAAGRLCGRQRSKPGRMAALSAIPVVRGQGPKGRDQPQGESMPRRPSAKPRARGPFGNRTVEGEARPVAEVLPCALQAAGSTNMEPRTSSRAEHDVGVGPGPPPPQRRRRASAARRRDVARAPAGSLPPKPLTYAHRRLDRSMAYCRGHHVLLVDRMLGRGRGTDLRWGLHQAQAD
jgi:hypothetical protein